MVFRTLLLLLLSLASIISYGQDQHELDSLQQLIDDPASHDTVVISAIVSKASIHRFNREKCEDDFTLGLARAEKLEDQDWKVSILGSQASMCYYEGDYPTAIEVQREIVEIRKAQGKQDRYASALGNLGVLYRKVGQFGKSLECYQTQLDHYKAANDSVEMGSIYNNMGNLYSSRGSHERALEYHRLALQIRSLIGDTLALTSSYHNIGMVHDNLRHNDSAIYFYEKALADSYQETNPRLRGNSLNNLGKTYERLGELDLAEEFLTKGRNFRDSIRDFAGLAQSLTNLARISLLREEPEKAIAPALEAIEIASRYNIDLQRRMAYIIVADAYDQAGMAKKANEYYVKFIELKDSLNQAEQVEAMSQVEVSYAYEKRFLADSLAEVQRTEILEMQFEEERKRQQSYVWASAIGGFIMLILALVLLRGYRNKQKANTIISEQKAQVESQRAILQERNTEITDSINYARRLQDAILPPREAIKARFPESFVFYEPKDIVAGDFYWMETVDEYTYLAVADCTGHGVPGAMVSVVCANALNKAVLELGITDPGQILNKTRELIIAYFSRGNEEVKDGMDIALIRVRGESGEHSVEPSPSTLTLEYAGAHNPLWIVRKGTDTIEEIKADKQPIGKFERATTFTTHTVTLNPDDSCYLFSDGFADQFGGPRGKKFKTSNLKTLLLSLQGKSMAEQEALIADAFVEWKGDLEQLDDVCLVGVGG